MAINFSGLKRGSVVGRVARSALALVPQNAVVPVLQGDLKGAKWVVGSSIHGCWLGTAEFEMKELFREFVKPGGVVFDIGANVGYYTLLSSKLAGPRGRVVCFEPLPRNIQMLHRHVNLNRESGARCTANVTVIEAAVGDHEGTVTFIPDVSPDRAHIVGLGDRNVEQQAEAAAAGSVGLTVKLVSIDGLTGRSADPIPGPSLMKIDVEGAEAMVLRGAAATIAKHKPTILLSTHGDEMHATCCTMLREFGYDLRPVHGDDITKAEELVAVARR